VKSDGLGKWSALNQSLAGRIFISYRRQETAWPAGRLYDVLVEHFPAEQVFKDVDNIEPGDEFVERITAAVESCDVLLALIGPQWLTITNKKGQRRLDDPEDYVRLEIEAALTRKIRVIPILVDEAQMPGADELPATLAPLVRRNAVEISPLTFDTKRLISTVQKTLAEQQALQQAEERARREAEERARQKTEEQSTVVVPSRPVVPAGLRGSTAKGQVDLRWDPPVAGSVAVVAWEVRRDGSRVGNVTEPWASDQPPGPGSYTYTVTAVGADGQHSAESSTWVRPGRRRRWLIPALAVLAAVLATAGLFLWTQPDGTGTAPPAVPPPVAPAGLTGDVSGAKIALRWNGAPSGTAAVAHWQVLRDGEALIEKVPVPQATVPNQGFHSYTVIAVGEDGQDSAQSQSWRAPPAWQKLQDTGFKDSFSAAGVAAHNGELWVVGGQDANSKRDEVRVFNPQTKKWRPGPKLPKGISHAPLVSAGDKLYLLGGLTATKDDPRGHIGGGDQRLGRCRPSPAGWCGVPLATVYSLDTENSGGTWIKENQLPAPRFSGAAAWDGQRLVFAGGAENYEPNRPAAADIWEPQSGKWKSIDAGLQPARERMAAATDGKGRIWFVGGTDLVPRKVYADVDVLKGDKVSDSTAIPTAVQGAAAIWTSETGACLFGGSTVLPNQTRMPVAKVQCLGGTDPGWPDMPKARYDAGAAVIDSTVYVVGGSSDSALKPADMVLALRFG
jgi:N-acetylneuraminic acid mutarotase